MQGQVNTGREFIEEEGKNEKMPKKPSKTIPIILTVLIGAGILFFYGCIISYFFVEEFEIGLLLMALVATSLVFAPLGYYEEKKQEYELAKTKLKQHQGDE